MEERIIDDEYGRGIRMKKTKDGYVDVTDELAEGGEEEFEETDEVDEQKSQTPVKISRVPTGATPTANRSTASRAVSRCFSQ